MPGPSVACSFSSMATRRGSRLRPEPTRRWSRSRSVLCLPLVKQAKLIGVLYLENNLATHVFTPARRSLLELLASQAAISLENARLYAELTISEERWRPLFESVPVGVNMVG